LGPIYGGVVEPKVQKFALKVGAVKPLLVNISGFEGLKNKPLICSKYE
jgi:hypothetical protein